jgi:hypothetical protein
MCDWKPSRTIRSDLDGGLDVLTSGDEGTGDDRVVGLAKDTDGTEEVLSGSLESIEETADLVGRHEDLGQLVVILEVDSPDGETVVVEPECQSSSCLHLRRGTHFS